MKKTKKISTENIYHHLKNIAKTIILQIKSALNNPVLIFIAIGFPILFVLGLGTLIRQSSLFASAFSIPLVLSIGVYYGYMKYSINDSTIGKNISLTNITDIEVTLATFATVFIFTIVQYYVEFGVMVIFESNGLVFSPTWVGVLAGAALPIDIVWANINYWMIFLFYFQTFILNITLYYAASKFVNEYRTFSIVTLLMVLFTLIFGGVLSSTWSFIDPNSGQYLLSHQQVSEVSSSENWNKVIYEEESYTFTNWFSYSVLFIPQWFNNQHFFNVLNSGGNNLNPEYSKFIDFYTILPEKYNLMFINPNDAWWNITLFAPYIYSAFYFVVGILMAKKKNRIHNDQ